jgi:hypothetical protein
MRGISRSMIILCIANGVSHVFSPRYNSFSHAFVTIFSIFPKKSFGIQNNSVKNNNELMIKNAIKNGLNMIFPIILIFEIGIPHRMRIGRDTKVTIRCV